MQKNEFSEPGLPSSKIMMRSSEVSVEDQKFLHILEKGTVMKDDHYVVPLLFQDTAFKFQLSCYWPSFCPCRTLKTSFTSAMPWQSFCWSNLKNFCICFSKHLDGLQQLPQECLIYVTHKGITKLISCKPTSIPRLFVFM